MMQAAADLPLWVACLTAILLLAGASFALVGSVGLVSLPTFYERVHAPTLGTSLGMACILAASMLYFTVLGGRPVVHEILIGVFVTITTPATLMLLARAALYRDRSERNADVPFD